MARRHYCHQFPARMIRQLQLQTPFRKRCYSRGQLRGEGDRRWPKRAEAGREGQLPASCCHEEPSSPLDHDDSGGPATMNCRYRPLSRGRAGRRAAVTSFRLSGRRADSSTTRFISGPLLVSEHLTKFRLLTGDRWSHVRVSFSRVLPLRLTTPRKEVSTARGRAFLEPNVEC